MNRFMLVSRCFLERDGKFLILRRISTDNHNPGLWEGPGGKIEDGQTFTYGRMREVFEETGLLSSQSSFVSCVDNYTVENGDHKGTNCLRIFSIMRARDGEVKLNPTEHDQFAWVTYTEMLRYKLTPEMRIAAQVLSEHLF